MNLTYCVYSAISAAWVSGGWLLLPEKRRLEIRSRGQTRLHKTEGILRKAVATLRKRMEHERKEREIYEAISFLRNVTAIGMSNRMSADLALQKLSENKGLLSPAYAKTLSFLRLNKVAEAVAAFESAADCDIAGDFIRAVLQWDEIDPKELTASLISYQKSAKEMRITSQKRNDELISDLIYAPVVVNVLVIFLNFIFVAYFLEQKEMLQGLFF
jgi:hypothetical protein